MSVPITPGIGVSVATTTAPAGEVQHVTQYAQRSQQLALLASETGDGSGSWQATDGLDGSLNLEVMNGAGSCTVTIQGARTATPLAQDIHTIAVILLDADGTPNLNRALAGSITVAANKSYCAALQELYPYTRATVTNAAGLGAGTSYTGVSATVYGLPG